MAQEQKGRGESGVKRKPPRRKNVSYKDIALEAGVSQMAVSYAMRNHPSIPESTRKRIHGIAERLGYVPDPKIAEFLQYMRGRRKVRDVPVLAYLHTGEARVPQSNSYNARLFAGANRRAAELGYKMEVFWLHEKAYSTGSLVRVMRARAMDGILIPPLPIEMEGLDLPWETFSVVTASYTSDYLGFNQVCNNRHQITELALQEARKRGYRRIGLVINKELDIRSSHNTLSYFYWFQSQQPQEERVPVLYEREIARDRFFRWLEENQVEVVVSGLNLLSYWIQDAGMRMPEDIAFISLSTYAGNPHALSGVDECAERVGSASIDLLTSQLHRNETGRPHVRKLILLEGRWVEGKTVRG